MYTSSEYATHVSVRWGSGRRVIRLYLGQNEGDALFVQGLVADLHAVAIGERWALNLLFAIGIKHRGRSGGPAKVWGL